jgi:uncharacterized sulfatase
LFKAAYGLQVVFLALVAGSGVVASLAEPVRPNILVILMDDLGWKDLGCYGNRFIETPHADRLAREGMRFTEAYAAAPVCSPTRASLLTGQHPARLGMFEVIQLRDRPFARLSSPPLRRELPENVESIADLLGQAGYACASVGKWHVGRTPPAEGFLPIPDEIADSGLRDLAVQSPQKRVGRLTAQTIQFLREHRSRPFLLMLNHHAVHAPLEAREDLVAKYDAKANALGVTNIHPVYAAITEMGDESLGQVMAELDRLQLVQRTVVIFTSDNGGLIEDMHLAEPTPLATCNLPLRSQKGDLYEGGIRVPLIVRWPGVTRPGGECASPNITPDLFATLLEITGVSAPQNQACDGVSLVPLLRGGQALDREILYWHFPTSMWSRWPGGAIRRGGYKLIEFFEDHHVELYDLANDPGETCDLARERPDLAASLLGELRRWRLDVGAEMPTPNPRYDPDRSGEFASPPFHRRNIETTDKP